MSDLEDLKTRLKIAKSKLQNEDPKKSDKKGIFLGNAFKLGTELVASVVVGTIIGFILDNWFDTKPLLIIIFFSFWSCSRNCKCLQGRKENAKG